MHNHKLLALLLTGTLILFLSVVMLQTQTQYQEFIEDTYCVNDAGYCTTHEEGMSALKEAYDNTTSLYMMSLIGLVLHTLLILFYKEEKCLKDTAKNS